jgi:hypothetical protein
VPGQRRKGAETTIQTHYVETITALFAKGGSGVSVQPCRRGTVRFLSIPVGRCDVQTSVTFLAAKAFAAAKKLIV